MIFEILTTFPEFFVEFEQHSIIGRAVKNQSIKLNVHNLRNWSSDSHKTTDDRPYGGGPGMVMMIEPISKALTDLQAKKGSDGELIILTSAKGTEFNQQKAVEFSKLNRLIIICGHYEGVDQRVAEYLADIELRVGNYVLTGGELASMIVVDAVGRLVPGVLGKHESLKEESHSREGYGEYPQYTRPADFNGWKVPEVLLEGNHQAISDWREQNAIDLNEVQTSPK